MKNKSQQLKVWWIPQIPMKPFYVPVSTISEARKILDVLADYDIFQYEHKIKPDYSNCGGLLVFDKTDTTDSLDGSWIEWEDEEGNDIEYFMRMNKNGLSGGYKTI